MRNTNINPNVEKADRVNQHHRWFVRTPSASSPITRLINFKLLPPPQCVNICNNTPANEQANIDSNRQSFIAPVRSLSNVENVWAILF